MTLSTNNPPWPQATAASSPLPGENETESKRAFARIVFADPFKNYFAAGNAVFPDNTSRALWVATHWRLDPQVLEFLAEIENEAIDAKTLKSSDELAAELLETARYYRTLDGEIAAKFYKMYAEAKGWVKKEPTVQINNNNQKVMLVESHGTNEQWEQLAAEQQRALIDAGDSVQH